MHGKGARGSGPRQREAYLFEEGRALLWWYMGEVRAEFCDDPDNPEAPLFPSERIPQAVSAWNVATPGIAVTPSTFRRTLKLAGYRFLTGPVTELHPHLLGMPVRGVKATVYAQSRRTTRSAPGCRRWGAVLRHLAPASPKLRLRPSSAPPPGIGRLVFFRPGVAGGESAEAGQESE